MSDNHNHHSALSQEFLSAGIAALCNEGFGALDALTQAIQHDDYPQMSASGEAPREGGGPSYVNPNVTARSGLPDTNNSHNRNHRVAPATMPPKPQPTLMRERKNAPKTDDLDLYRAEIEQRVRSGETSRSIADDLASRGVNTNEKALVHRRIKWGLRVRVARNSGGNDSTDGTFNRYQPVENDETWSRQVEATGEDWEAHVREAVQRVGIDPASADISGTYPPSGAPLHRSHSANNPPPGGWRHPHKHEGGRRKSNLEDFKDQIIERTKHGETCEEIAAALKAQGVQTSDRAVNRRRLIWGLRQRAVRKDTPYPTLDVTGKYVNHAAIAQAASNRVKPKGLLRRLEVARMTKEGMTPEEIAEILTARGVVWKKGAASVRRMQSVWGLSAAQDPLRQRNIRERMRQAVRKEQRVAFREIAQDLGIEHVEEWVVAKAKEPQAKQARLRLVRERLGPDFAPTVKASAKTKKPSQPRVRKPRRPQQREQGMIDVSEDESDNGSSSSADESSSEEETPPSPRTLRSGVVNVAERQAAREAASSSNSGSDSDSGSEFQDDQQQAKSARQSWDDCLTAVRASATQVNDSFQGHFDTMDVDEHDQAADEDVQDEDDDDDDPDSAANVAARIFARIGKILPKATSAAPKPIPFLPPRSRPKRRPAATNSGSKKSGQATGRRESSTDSRPKTVASHKLLTSVSSPQASQPVEDDAMD